MSERWIAELQVKNLAREHKLVVSNNSGAGGYIMAAGTKDEMDDLLSRIKGDKLTQYEAVRVAARELCLSNHGAEFDKLAQALAAVEESTP